MSGKRIQLHFILNPKSGSRFHLPILEYLETELPETVKWTLHETKYMGHATELAMDAVQAKADVVVAIGGDGTVNEVGKALIGTDIPLGIIPKGSGNGFARHLKLPMMTGGALKRITQLNTLTIDTATLNGRSFLATAGLGFDAVVGKRFSELNHRGLPSYIRASAETFFNFKPFGYQLEIDGKEYEGEAFLINFANAGQYGNNAWIAPSASLTDGRLNVCILKPFPSHHTPDIILKIFNKQIERSRFYQLIKAEKIVVKNPGQYHIDGEPLEGETNLSIEVNPRSLKVII